jgi:5-methylcytosine-specific restriction protein A
MIRRQFSVRALRGRLADFGGRCACGCGQEITAATGLEWDHVIPLELGGDDDLENLQPLTAKCHRAKTQRDVKAIAKAKRVQAKHLGIKGRKQELPGGRGSRWKKKVSGEVVPR